MVKYFLEIRNRLVLLVTTWLFILLVSYFYKEILLFLCVQPDRFVDNNDSLSIFYFIFTNVTEVFSVYIKLIFFIGTQVFVAYLIYHFFVFFSPAMFKVESSVLITFLKVSVLVWFFSIILFNFFLVPLTWNFFLSFQSLVSHKFIPLHFEAKLMEYTEFYVLLYYLCIFYCQIFTFLFFFLSYVNNKIKTIRKFRKLYYYFFVIFSTLVSPPDIISQVLISVFVIFFYEVLVFSFLIKNCVN